MPSSEFVNHLLVILVSLSAVSGAAAQTPEKRAWSRKPSTDVSGKHEPELQPLFSVGVRPSVRRVVAQDADLQILRQPDVKVPSTADLQQRRDEKRQRYQILRSRLSGLVQDWQRSEIRTEQQAVNRSQDDSSAEDQNTTVQRPVQPDLGTNPPPELPGRDGDVGSKVPIPTPAMPRAADAPSVPTMSSMADQQSDAKPNDMTTSDQLLAERISSEDVLVDGPVDRVALADNLYAIGRYSSALEMYARVDLSQLTADQQYWVQYQTASCHRQRGDLVAARKQLRILAGQEESGWLGRSSTWWLNALRDRSELENEITALRERINDRRDDAHAAATRQ